jgi:hypothetical protein
MPTSIILFSLLVVRPLEVIGDLLNPFERWIREIGLRSVSPLGYGAFKILAGPSG